MKDKALPRCNNCLRLRSSDKGHHPYLCPGCRDALRHKGPNCTGEFSPRKAWWVK